MDGASPIRRWWSVDLLLVAYLFATAILALIFSERIPGAYWIAGGHVGGAFAYLLVKLLASRHRRLLAVYILAPLVVVLSVFETLGFIIPHLRADAVASLSYDAALAQLDLAIFGADPTRWFEGMLNPISATALQLCYATYYFLPILLAILLLKRGRFATALSYSGALVGCFFTTYVGYYVVPAYGPRAYLEYDSPLPLGALGGWVYRTIDNLDNIGLNAFPSGHTAVTLLCLALVWREDRRLALAAVPVCAGLILATLALRYHYAVDVVAGAAVALIWIVGGLPAILRFDRSEPAAA